MLKVLIVDDDCLVRAYLKAIIDWEYNGFEVVVDVDDGEKALEYLRNNKADLMLTDISMPIMDGIQLIKEVRKQNSKIRIAVLSCHDDFNYVKEALKSGADDYVLKNDLNDDNAEDFVQKMRGLFKNQTQVGLNKPDERVDEKERTTAKTMDKMDESKEVIKGRELPRGITNATVIQGIAYIQDHYTEALSLTDIADYLDVNVTYLSRIFKQETKVKFTEFMTRLRIEHAQELLKLTNKKVKDISTECGFYEYRYFCKVFKQYSDMSPREYRKMNLIKNYSK